MKILNHETNPEIPPGIELEIPDDGPNLHAIDVILASIQKMIIEERVKTSLQLLAISKKPVEG